MINGFFGNKLDILLSTKKKKTELCFQRGGWLQTGKITVSISPHALGKFTWRLIVTLDAGWSHLCSCWGKQIRPRRKKEKEITDAAGQIGVIFSCCCHI